MFTHTNARGRPENHYLLNDMQQSEDTCMKNSEDIEIKVKTPKRVLHFSDGVLEEYSDDDDGSTPPLQQNTAVDPATLPWLPWLGRKFWSAGSTAVTVCDYLGESLASVLGITTPKYWFEIEERKRIEAELVEKQKQAEGWSEPSSSSNISLNVIKTKEPSSSNTT